MADVIFSDCFQVFGESLAAQVHGHSQVTIADNRVELPQLVTVPLEISHYLFQNGDHIFAGKHV